MPKAIRKTTKAVARRTNTASTSKDKKRPIAKKAIAKKPAKPAVAYKAVPPKRTALVRKTSK